MTLFLRLLAHDDKPAALADAVQRLRDGQPCPDAYAVEPESFRQVPGAPFAYWVSERVRRMFRMLSPFESEGRSIRVGLQSSDDFRFIRVWWEVARSKLVSGSREAPTGHFRELTRTGRRWVPFAKGGDFSPFYSDLPLVVNWEQDGEEMKAWNGSLYGGVGWSKNIRNVGYYFRSGLTWPIKNRGSFKPWPLPLGCIFSHIGACGFFDNDSETVFLALMSSSVFTRLLRVTAGWNYEVGVIQRTPIPDLSGEEGAKLGELARSAVDLKRSLDTANETSHVFHLPALLQVPGATLAERVAAWQAREADADRQLAEIQREIDDIAFRLYGIDGEDRKMMETGAGAVESPDADEDEAEDES